MSAMPRFPENSWYCAGWSHELKDAPLGRTLLGNYVVMFRDETGQVVALDGRCPHRFAPLGEGVVVGNAIACPYHRLRFGRDGRCVLNPNGAGKVPSDLQLRVFPVAERHGVLWIWGGEPGRADRALLPEDGFLVDPSYSTATSYLKINAHYQLAVDNLLDFTHGVFLHARTLLGAADQEQNLLLNEVPGSIDHEVKLVDGGVVHSIYRFPPLPPTGLRRRLVTLDRVCTRSTMIWHPASTLVLQTDVWPESGIGVGPPVLRLPSLHYITPESERTSHYFVAIGRNFKLGDSVEDEHMIRLVMDGFIDEDEPMIRRCQELMDSTDVMAMKPTILETDRAAILARRTVARMIERKPNFDPDEAKLSRTVATRHYRQPSQGPCRHNACSSSGRMMMPDRATLGHVAIVGAGPAGLATAIELGRRGIRCRLFERSERVGLAPRAKTTHVRTREFMRMWGIADKLAAAAPFGIDYPSNVHFVTRLNGPGLLCFADALNCSPAKDGRYSEHGQWLPQYRLEAVMREHALSLDTVTIEFGMEFISLTQDERCVYAVIRSIGTGEDQLVECDYLVGADGARSRVRQEIGGKMEGRHGLSRNYNVIFEAPGLADAHGHGPGIMYWQINPDVPSIIGPMDRGDLWFFMPTMLAPGLTLTNEQLLDAIRVSTGINLPYRILSSDEWIASQLVSDRHRKDRVFLVGDACHLHPPLGGFGMNMGVADGVDIGWKLAAALQGWGGPALLDSYEAERRPTHQHVVDAAASHHASLPNHLVRPHIEDDTSEGEAVRAQVTDFIREHKEAEFNALGIVLGCRYLNSPVIKLEEAQPGWKPNPVYEPSAMPGSIAPHVWLDDGRSLYDLFGDGFTLLVLGSGHEGDIGLALKEASTSRMRLTIAEIDDTNLAVLYEAELALIRPDQFVAWRGDAWPSAPLLPFVGGFALAGAEA